jgi:hypothetical protein
MKGKKIRIAILATLCLTLALLVPMETRSQSGEPEYDMWADINDDGIVDIFDLVRVALAFGGEGLPPGFNKTQTLVDLDGMMRGDLFRAGLLVPLPSGATHWGPDGKYTSAPSAIILHSLDLDQGQAGNQQTIMAWKGSTITVTGEYQCWNPPGITLQAFFICSWTPSWPPPNSTYYYAVYDGSPGPYPGTGKTQFGFDITVPNQPGTYYLYYCLGAEYSMPNAVQKYATPLWAPYAIIHVSGES